MRYSARKATLFGAILPLCMLAVAPAAVARDVEAARFNSVEVKGDGKVTMRKGRLQRVKIVKGDPKVSSFRVVRPAGSDGSSNRLVINTCAQACPAGYELEIEITSPDDLVTATAGRPSGSTQS